MKQKHPWWYIRNELVNETGIKRLVSPWWHVRNIIVAWTVSWTWVVVLRAIFRAALMGQATDAPVSPIMSLVLAWADSSTSFKTALQGNAFLALFFILIFAPFVEEALFRALPLTLVKHQEWDVIRIVAIALCGIVFGRAHGSAINVLFQGFAGLAMAWVYLRNRTTPLAGYLSAVAVHFLYNATIVVSSGLS